MISEKYVYCDSVVGMSAKKDKNSVEKLKTVLRDLVDKTAETEQDAAKRLADAQLYLQEADAHVPSLH